jgi:hypothetical protein
VHLKFSDFATGDVVIKMIFVEPEDVYLVRLANQPTPQAIFERNMAEATKALNRPPGWEEGWDGDIMSLLRNREGFPVRIWDVVTPLAKGFAKGRKHRREVVKYILSRVSFMLQQGWLRRVCRTHVQIHPQFEPLPPLKLPSPEL